MSFKNSYPRIPSILALVLLMLFVYCSKDNNISPKPNTETKQPQDKEPEDGPTLKAIDKEFFEMINKLGEVSNDI